MSEVGELWNMGPAAAFEKIEQRTGGACQDPLCREAGFGHQSVAVLEISEAEGHVGVGTEGEVGTHVPRRLDDGAAVAFTARAGVAEGGVVELQRYPILCRRLDHGLDIDGEGGIAGVAYHVDPAALDGVDHGLGVGGLIAGGEHRLVKACHDHVEPRLVAFGEVDLAVDVLDVGFDAAQDADPLDHPWQHVQIDEVPEVRGIGHVGAMIRGGEQLDPLCPRDGQVVVNGAVGVGAGDGVGVGIDCVLHLIFPSGVRRQHSKGGGSRPCRGLSYFVTNWGLADKV